MVGNRVIGLKVSSESVNFCGSYGNLTYNNFNPVYNNDERNYNSLIWI